MPLHKDRADFFHLGNGIGWRKDRKSESKLLCKCGSMSFIVKETEDGDIYVKCLKCGNEATIQYN